MQRQTSEGVILACDFCGTDWDMVKPMIEGHRGSVLCLKCLARAIDQSTESTTTFKCTLCQQERLAPMKVYRQSPPIAEANPDAVLCWDCVQQADRVFSKDPDTEWDRKLKPTDRWR